jgi:hypothetical protein
VAVLAKQKINWFIAITRVLLSQMAGPKAIKLNSAYPNNTIVVDINDS